MIPHLSLRLFLPLLLIAVIGLTVLPAGVMAQNRSNEMPDMAAVPREPVAIAPGVGGPASIKKIGAGASVKQTIAIPVNTTRDLELPVEIREAIVGNPAIADVLIRSPRHLHIAGKTVGGTNIFLVDKQGRTVAQVAVDVHLNVEALRDIVSRAIPDAAVHIDAVGDSVYLSGSVRSDTVAADIYTLARRMVKEDANIVNMIRVSQEQQVLLQVRVAEVQKTVLEELGVRTRIAEFELFDGNTFSLSANDIGRSTTAFGSAVIGNPSALMSTINLLERRGLVKTLAEPNLTAVSGETAKLLAGGELPIPKSDQNGQISFEFKPFGVTLGFVPVVLGPDRISLKLSTEVSALSSTVTVQTANTIIPALTVRRASTTVEMPSGGSLMIAGMLQNDLSTTFNGLPGLMNLPIIGALFRSTAFQKNETELVVTVSAYVIRPVQARALALPTDGFAPSSDFDRYFLGRLYSVHGHGAEIGAKETLHGPIGHILR